jgi:hypothetical protein
MSVPKPSFDTVTLGSDKNALIVQLLKFPRTDAPLLEKVQAFAYFEEVICQHRAQLSSVTVQQAYANNIPVSSSVAASKEANRIGCQLYEAFFLVSNLSCLGFFCSDGSRATIHPHPSKRSAAIGFVQFEAIVAPGIFSPDLASISPATVSFFLKLPQSSLPARSATPNIPAQDAAALAAAALTPATAAMVTTIRAVFAAGGTIVDLNLADPAVTAALSNILSNASNPTAPAGAPGTP